MKKAAAEGYVIYPTVATMVLCDQGFFSRLAYITPEIFREENYPVGYNGVCIISLVTGEVLAHI
jgi:hypothetical protein